LHIETYDRKSAAPIGKERYDMLMLKEVFRHADEDLSQNCAKYYEEYQRR